MGCARRLVCACHTLAQKMSKTLPRLKLPRKHKLSPFIKWAKSARAQLREKVERELGEKIR